MEPRLVQHQTQRLILSPQIRQYLKLLQLPTIELKQAVETALAENPLLDEKASVESVSEDSLTKSDSESVGKDNAEELRFSESFDHYEKLDETFKEHYDEDKAPLRDPGEMQKSRDFQENLIVKKEGLAEFLMWQIRMSDFNNQDLKIAHEIVGNINDDGYLQSTPDEIAEACRSNSLSVQEVLKRIQEFDPPGVGAKDLREALLLQLKRLGPNAKVALTIVKEHLSILEKRDWKLIAKILNIDLGSVKKAATIIARLEPKPGRIFYADESIAVTPDATVTFDDDHPGQLKIELHNEYIPELRINSYYRKLLRKKDTDKKTREFLREKMQNALNFMRALSLRKSTIHEITEEIVKAQPDFFEKGFGHLKPLRLKDVAGTLGIHESTVSRAVQGKYIHTPQGTIPYRSFFSSKLETTTGESESQKSIMEKLKTLVQKEDPRKPLSDQALVKMLQNNGIVIARRTIAKYRDILKILPSHLRKKK